MALAVAWVVTGAMAWRWKRGTWPSPVRIVFWLFAEAIIATFCLFTLPWLTGG